MNTNRYQLKSSKNLIFNQTQNLENTENNDCQECVERLQKQLTNSDEREELH